MAEQFYCCQNLIDGYNVNVEFYQDNCDFEVDLRTKQPTKVILFEHTLEHMRAIEIYNAERTQLNNQIDPINVHLIRYDHSSETYQYFSTVENEKRAFAELIQIKKSLNVSNLVADM